MDNLSEEVSKGMREKAEQGIWPSSAPLGYINIEQGDKRAIGLDPDRADLVRKMFEWYASGPCSLAEIGDRGGRNGEYVPPIVES